MASYRWVFWLLAAVGLVLDQASKYGIYHLLYNGGAGGEIVVLADYFTIEAHFHRTLHGTWTGTDKKGKTLSLIFSHNGTVKVQADQQAGTGTVSEPAEGDVGPVFNVSITWENQGKSLALFDGFDGPVRMESVGPARQVTPSAVCTRQKPWREGDSEIVLEHPPRVNQGALFGVGSGHNGLFAIISIGAAVVIVYFSGRPGPRRDLLLSISLGLILAGTLGNFYDRVVFSGVRDFIHWFVRRDGKLATIFGVPADWPIFNIADCCLVVGAGTLLLHAFFFPESRVPPPATPSQQEPAAAQP